MLEIVNYTYFGISLVILATLFVQRIQVRHIKLTWHTGLLFGFPFLPSVMTIFSLVSFLVSLFLLPTHLAIHAGFFFGNMIVTCIIGLLLVEKIITENEIILFPFFKSKRIATHAIRDYFYVTNGYFSTVTIIYKDNFQTKRRSFNIPNNNLGFLELVLETRQKTRQQQPVSQWFIN